MVKSSRKLEGFLLYSEEKFSYMQVEEICRFKAEK
jgi:hypothetical protein